MAGIISMVGIISVAVQAPYCRQSGISLIVFSTVISRIFSLPEVVEIFINLFVYLLFSDGEVDSNPAQYREIQVNQLSEASEAGGFLPPIQTTGMYSMVH